ncbi:MAG TPA: peptidase T, partial [Spirochaetales bacterium]|nr:peptidase T [Spirochaetales bacterium]
MKDFADILARPHTAETIERLVRYAKIETTSDRHVDVIPSTPSQWNLARLLETEIKALGVADVSVDEHCFVIARIPATPGCEKKPTIGLMAHLDTSSEV